MLDNIPQPLYKYRVWNDPIILNAQGQVPSEITHYSRRILTENEVYFASANQFNDPFDAALPFRYREADMTPDNIFLKLYQIMKDNHPDMLDSEIIHMCYLRQSTGVFDDGKYWKDYYPEFKEIQNKTFGILSLTEHRDNLLMWSHYADSHRGFCVGLDKFILFKHCAGTLSPVHYENSFPFIPLFRENPIGLQILAITKSKHWEYEDEYRFVNLSPRQTIQIPNEALLEIILGCKMPEDQKEIIYQLADTKFKNAKIFEAQMNSENFQLDMIPIIK